MEQTDTYGLTLRNEIERLNAELEQARAALDDANEATESLARERDAALLKAAVQMEARAEAEAGAARVRQNMAALLASAYARQNGEPPDHAEELRILLDKTTALAEELREANDALTASNRELDLRVAERTSELRHALGEVEKVNAELSRRVDAEVAARAEVQAKLFQMQKLEAIGQLTGGIAHDFNNLLTVMISGLQLLEHARDPAQRARLLRRAEEAAWRGADLTRRLLAFARRQTLMPDYLDLTRQVDGLRELLTHSLRENIGVRTEIAPDLWPVEADFGALELALLNLAVNARDAMPDGGTLVVAARNAPITGPAADLMGIAAGDYVEVSVVDSGSGMSSEVLDRAFEPFFTTKSDAQGSGLGLAQVYGFAKQSGGVAWITSQPGSGTTVFLLLPRSLRPAPEETPRLPVATEARDPVNLSILVVEDDNDVAAGVLDMLGQMGHQPQRVSTVASALAVLSSGTPVDLVFSDVLLPGGGSGLDLAREIVRRQLGVPIILTSGYGGGVTGRLAAADLPFLRKPYQTDALRRAVKEALERGRARAITAS